MPEPSWRFNGRRLRDGGQQVICFHFKSATRLFVPASEGTNRRQGPKFLALVEMTHPPRRGFALGIMLRLIEQWNDMWRSVL